MNVTTTKRLVHPSSCLAWLTRVPEWFQHKLNYFLFCQIWKKYLLFVPIFFIKLRICKISTTFKALN
jgi:hypothetical protein